ncbi:MAG: hypothetical protein LBI79_10565 [Nitrososphaerota archaeon]|jgi:hypothetical protein|nr:hypothetical protein [Nitrososphaerota archaeon]
MLSLKRQKPKEQTNVYAMRNPSDMIHPVLNNAANTCLFINCKHNLGNPGLNDTQHRIPECEMCHYLPSMYIHDQSRADTYVSAGEAYAQGIVEASRRQAELVQKELEAIQSKMDVVLEGKMEAFLKRRAAKGNKTGLEGT